MSKQRSGIIEEWSNLGDNLIKWFESKTTTKRKTLKILIMLSLIMVIVETISAITGLVMLYLPRLTAIIVILCIAIPLIILLFTPFLFLIETISSKIAIRIWIAGIAMAAILFIIGSGLFWFGGEGTIKIPLLVRKLFFGPKTRFPLGWLQDIALDSNGRLYAAITSYNRTRFMIVQETFKEDGLLNLPLKRFMSGLKMRIYICS